MEKETKLSVKILIPSSSLPIPTSGIHKMVFLLGQATLGPPTAVRSVLSHAVLR